MTSATFELARELISRVSITPNDGGCQDVLAQRLARLGFGVERMRFGDVDNLLSLIHISEPTRPY